MSSIPKSDERGQLLLKCLQYLSLHGGASDECRNLQQEISTWSELLRYREERAARNSTVDCLARWADMAICRVKGNTTLVECGFGPDADQAYIDLLGKLGVA